MIGWIILAVYVAGFIPCWRTAAWLVVEDFKVDEKPDGVDIVMGIFLGSFISLFWPIVVPARLVYNLRIQDSPLLVKFLRVPATEKKRIKVRELEERERRIKELERELGVR